MVPSLRAAPACRQAQPFAQDDNGIIIKMKRRHNYFHGALGISLCRHLFKSDAHVILRAEGPKDLLLFYIAMRLSSSTCAYPL
jgi:hypothetical protein